MKLTKRFLALLLALLMTLLATGCADLAESLLFEETDTTYSESIFDTEKAQADSEAVTSATDSEQPQYETEIESQPQTDTEAQSTIDKDGIYTSKEDVALYIHTYGTLPSNFITKKEAEKLGWSGGGLDKYAKDKCIGGSRFGNYEGLLPEKDGRYYTECDIDTLNKSSRGAKRIVFSNDGLIYYTEDHYETFELLYDGN